MYGLIQCVNLMKDFTPPHTTAAMSGTSRGPPSKVSLDYILLIIWGYDRRKEGQYDVHVYDGMIETWLQTPPQTTLSHSGNVAGCMLLSKLSISVYG